MLTDADIYSLSQIGIECYRVRFPVGMDANEYALKVTPANKSLGVLLNAAQWLGKGHEVSSETDVARQSGDGKPRICWAYSERMAGQRPRN